MINTNFLKKLACASAASAVLFAAGSEAFSQKGKGKREGREHSNGWSKGNGGGEKEQRRSGGRFGGQQHPGLEMKRGWEQKREQRSADWNARRQQQQVDWNAQRQQQINEWNQRRHQAEGEKRQRAVNEWNARRQQKQADWNAQRQQQVNEWNARKQQQAEWNSRRQQRVHELNARRQQQSEWNARRQQQINEWNARRQQQQVNDWNNRGHRSKRSREMRRHDQREWNGWQQAWIGQEEQDRKIRKLNRRGHSREIRVVRGPQQYYQQQIPILQGIFSNNPMFGAFGNDRFYRKDMKRALRAERRAQRQYERQQRREARWWSSQPVYVYENSADEYYPYNSDNGYNSYDDGYDSRGDWKQQLVSIFISSFLGGNNYDESPLYAYQNGVGRAREQRVPRYYESPMYVGYADDRGYGPTYAYDDYDGGTPSLGLGGLLSQLPIQELVEQFVGDDFVSGLLGNFLAQGYDEGYFAGQWARENGQDEVEFYDPYAMEGTYSPYSASLGLNREVLSEGYSLGFADALRQEADQNLRSGGEVDLVSALLGNILSNS